MTVIEIPGIHKLPMTHRYDWIQGGRDAALAEFGRRHPTYKCPAVYVAGDNHWFVMEWKRG